VVARQYIQKLDTMSELKQLNQLMLDSAEDAVKYVKHISDKDIKLDYAGLGELDLVLDELAKENAMTPLEDKVLFTVSTMFGAFIGELFKIEAGGEWFMDESDPKAPFIVLNYAGRAYPFASVCFEKIVNNSEISACRYFELALSNLEA
jgi:hypothetical protein